MGPISQTPVQAEPGPQPCSHPHLLPVTPFPRKIQPTDFPKWKESFPSPLSVGQGSSGYKGGVQKADPRHGTPHDYGRSDRGQAWGGVTGPVPPWFGGPEASGLNCCDLFLECHEGNASSFPVKVLLTNSRASRNLPCHMLLPEDMEKQRVQAAFTKDPEKTALSESLALAGTLPVMDGLRQN